MNKWFFASISLLTSLTFSPVSAVNPDALIAQAETIPGLDFKGLPLTQTQRSQLENIYNQTTLAQTTPGEANLYVANALANMAKNANLNPTQKTLLLGAGESQKTIASVLNSGEINLNTGKPYTTAQAATLGAQVEKNYLENSSANNPELDKKLLVTRLKQINRIIETSQRPNPSPSRTGRK